MIEYNVCPQDNDVYRLQINVDYKVEDEINNEENQYLYKIGNIAMKYYNKGWQDAVKKIRDDLTVSGNSYMEIDK